MISDSVSSRLNDWRVGVGKIRALGQLALVEAAFGIDRFL
jgi:hypothetical protein